MKLQLKRSNVIESGAAKPPSSEQMEYGELAVNYNLDDPAIFLKDSNDNIIRISGIGNIADDGQVELPASTLPPDNPKSGNLWFNSDDGRLYIYYTDADTSQWVDASPDSWDPTVLPDSSDPSEQPGTLDVRYVSKVATTSQDIAGDFTSAGSIISGGDPNDGSAIGAKLLNLGIVQATRSSGSSAVWTGYTQGTTAPSSRIDANGSATFALNGVFAGGVRAGAIDAASPTTGILGSNIGETGTISATAAGANNVFVGREVGSTAITSSIGSTGDATFAGDVNAAGYVSGGSATSTYGLLGQASGGNAAVIGRQYDNGGFTWTGANSAGTITSSISAAGAATFAGAGIFRSNLTLSGTGSGNAFYIGDGAEITMTYDGAATFAGNLDVGFNSGSSSGTGFFVQPNGQSYLFTASDIDALSIWQGGDRNVFINSSGAATFAGAITSTNGSGSVYYNLSESALIAYDSDANGAVPKVTINKSGSAEFAAGLATIDRFGQLSINTPTDTGIAFESRVLSGAATCTISGSGAASFKNITDGAYTYIANKPGTDALCLSGGSSGDPNTTWWQIKPNGDFNTLGAATFAGTVTANGSVLTRAAGDLDVGDRLEKADAALQTLKTAAAASTDFASLKSAIATALANI